MKTDFDFIVIGGGLFGSAAAKYLQASGASTLLINPQEPQAKDYPTTTVFASHYDQGRVTRRFGKNDYWTALNHQTLLALPKIQAESGVPLFESEGSLYVTESAEDAQLGYLQQALQNEVYQAFSPTFLNPKELKGQFPQFNFTEASFGYVEYCDAGHLNPRKLVEAQTLLFKKQGGVVRQELATQLVKTEGGYQVSTSTDALYKAPKVLLCCGGFHNFLAGAPQLALKLKSETIVLAEVSAHTAKLLENMPSLLYEITRPEYDSIYLIKPLLYPDGKYYLKMGANLKEDVYLTSSDDVKNWFNTLPSNWQKETLSGILETLFPGVQFLSYQVKPCLITYSDSKDPIIERLDNGLFVCTAGNGYGAMCSDAIGYKAFEQCTME